MAVSAKTDQSGPSGRGARARSRSRPSSPPPAEAGSNGQGMSPEALEALLEALDAAKDGDFSVRLPTRKGGLEGQLAAAFNELVERNAGMSAELERVGRVIGREGKMGERAALDGARGSWKDSVDSVNAMIDDLVRPTTEVARVIEAVAEGDLSQKMALKIEGQPVKGEFLRIGTTARASRGRDRRASPERDVGLAPGWRNGGRSIRGSSGCSGRAPSSAPPTAT